jgi:hypothetical protein
MARPVTGEALLLTGIVLALYPRDLQIGLEIQRAPDTSGSPDLGNLVIVGSVVAGVTIFTDTLPLDGARRHYRSRHRQGNAVSAWTGWASDLPAIIPDPLPPVPALTPTIDVTQTVSAGSVSFNAVSSLGEIEFGTVEFQDPERTFTGTGSITATDKTLTVSDGDFTDEDVGLYVSVVGAGAAGALLESRIDSVTSATVVELEDAAGTTVATKNVVLGGGWFSDFDYDGTDESNETNTRNRPVYGRDQTWIMFRATANNDVSSPQLINMQPQVAATLTEVDLAVNDDFGASGDDQYTFTWTPSNGVTDSYSIDLEGGKEDDRGAILVSGTESSPASTSSEQLDDAGAADNSATPKHWGRFTLKDSGGTVLGTWEVHDIIPTL